MASVNIASSDNITGIRLKEQASSPTTPPAGFAQLFVNTTPAVQFEDDAGTVRTLSDTTHTHSASDITSGTLDVARIPSLPASQITSGTLAEARIPSLSKLTLAEQGTAPATPASGFAELFVDTTPALKFKNDAGTVVTVSDTTHTHAASAITSGTLDNARVNWAAPSAIGGTTAAAGTFTSLDVNAANANADLTLNRSTSNIGYRSRIWLKTNGSTRWYIGTNGNESSGNAGSDLAFLSYDDSGNFLSETFSITRATGVLTALPTYSKTITSSVRDLQIDSNGVFGYVASARKHKHKIRPIKETPRFIAKLRKLNPVRYRYKVDGDGDGEVDDVLIHYGFVAEEVEQVFPELCSYDIVPDEGAEIIRDENGNLDPSVPTRKEIATLNYSELHALAIAGLQHALDKIDELEAKVKELERRLVRLEVRA